MKDARHRAILSFACTAGVLLLGWMVLGKGPVQPKTKAPAAESVVKKEADGYFLGADIDQKAYVERLESQYFSVTEKNQALASRVEELGGKLGDMAKGQARLLDMITGFEQRLTDVIQKTAVQGVSPVEVNAGPDVRKYQLDVISINPVKVKDKRMVYLPAGSFVRGTLLTGVYAPADSSNPLPVLIRLNEAFYGPNESRIPLEGAFAIGKTSGDLNSERALVQITTMSSVFPDGETFEHKGNIGYLTDISGQLGLKGVVVRNTGGQLAMSFMTGFMGGASQAMADAQTTTVAADTGTRRNVTGSRSKNAVFQGINQSAAQMSKYYQDQLEKIVPAVKVEAGVDVYFIVLEGVEVYGLEKDRLRPAHYID